MTNHTNHTTQNRRAYLAAVADEACELRRRNPSWSLADAVDVSFGLTDPVPFGLRLTSEPSDLEMAAVLAIVAESTEPIA